MYWITKPLFLLFLSLLIICHNAFKETCYMRHRCDFSQFMSLLCLLIQPYQKSIKLKMCSQPFLHHRIFHFHHCLLSSARKRTWRCYTFKRLMHSRKVFIALANEWCVRIELAQREYKLKRFVNFCSCLRNCLISRCAKIPSKLIFLPHKCPSIALKQEVKLKRKMLNCKSFIEMSSSVL
jgi:hypothetical protein